MVFKVSQIFATLVLLCFYFFVLFATEELKQQTQDEHSTQYVLKEEVLMTIPPCNDTSQPGVVCASFLAKCGSFRPFGTTGRNNTGRVSSSKGNSNTTSEGEQLMSLVYDRGMRFYRPNNITGKLDLINELAVNCDQLEPIGPYKGQFLLLHNNSPRCTCQDPGTRPCPLQIQVLNPIELQGFINYIEGSVTTPVRALRLPVEAVLVMVNATGNVTGSSSREGCSPFQNADQVRGNIALIYRGTCFFQEKVDYAEKAGATSVIIVNRKDTPLIQMGVTSNIPTVMISFESGELLRVGLLSSSVVLKLGRNTGTILAHPSADLPFGLGTIPVRDIVEGKNLTVTPHTEIFKWIDRGYALDADRGYLWLFRVDDTSTTLVLDLNRGAENASVLYTFLNSPLLDISPKFIKRNNHYYALGVTLDGNTMLIYNITQLPHVRLVVEVPIHGGYTIFPTTNGTALYVPVLLTVHRIEVFNALNLTAPHRVFSFTEIAGDSATIQPTGMYLSLDSEFLWISWSSLGVTVYDLRENRFHPKKLAPLLDTTPQTVSEYTVGVQQICGYPNDNYKAVGINTNDEGKQEIIQMFLERRNTTESSQSTS